MLRALCPLLALGAAVFSIAVELIALPPDHDICRRGGCRYDQLYSTVETKGASAAAWAAMVEEDPSDPHAWASYGEYLAMTGKADAAHQVFDQALTLGSGLAPVLMRIANFDFMHGRSARGLELVPRILTQTPNYDEIPTWKGPGSSSVSCWAPPPPRRGPPDPG